MMAVSMRWPLCCEFRFWLLCADCLAFVRVVLPGFAVGRVDCLFFIFVPCIAMISIGEIALIAVAVALVFVRLDGV